MRITFGEREVACLTCRDKAEFDELLSEKNVDSIVIGDDVEGERGYHIVTVHSSEPARTRVRIGVVSAVQGVGPRALLHPATQQVWLGFNSRVVVVDTNVPLIRHAFELDSFFYHFLPVQTAGMTLVVHETGIVAVSNGYEVVWTLATDVIASVQLSPNEMRLEFMDDPAISVDPSTGKRL